MNLFDGEHQQRGLLLVFIILFCSSCLVNVSLGQALGLQQARLPDNEVEDLKEIADTLKKTDWNFSVNPCSGESGWNTTGAPKRFENYVACNCTFENNTICHVTEIVLKSQNLSGFLPPELVKLPYLKTIDLSRNYLYGTIPKEWGSMQLVKISLLGNRLSGPIPRQIGNIISLTELVLEANQLSGFLPTELGQLINIKRIVISSNKFTGILPDLSGLVNLEDFRISDNNFIGKLPNFIGKWTKLQKLVIQGSGFEGPVPSDISLLENLKDLRISDLNGLGITFPPLNNMKNLKYLILRSCNITGEIPSYLNEITSLKMLDLSFNQLTGEIPSNFAPLEDALDYLYLTENSLSGTVPDWMLKTVKSIDLSYNHFTLEISGAPSCPQQNLNVFGGSLLRNSSTESIPCLNIFSCARELDAFHINCGGGEVKSGDTTYEEDFDPFGSSRFYRSKDNWAFSSTGQFLDNGDENDYYIAQSSYKLSMENSQLYTTTRLSPLSLTYYGFCLKNENYDVSLHFAEIMFTNDTTYSSLGRRIFDVYIQGNLVLKDFNIAEEAGGVGKAVIKRFTTVVTNKKLEVRFKWSGKGTTGIPKSGTYGPLVSAISVTPNFKSSSRDGKKISTGGVVEIVAAVLCLIFMILGILWWKECFQQKNEIDQGEGFYLSHPL